MKTRINELIPKLTRAIGIENMEAQELFGEVCYEIGKMGGRVDALELILGKKNDVEVTTNEGDSKGHNLPEPSSEKIGQLIKELEKFTKVNLKPNLKRIYTFSCLNEIGGKDETRK